jgi:hypothetical protein
MNQVGNVSPVDFQKKLEMGDGDPIPVYIGKSNSNRYAIHVGRSS